MNTLVYILGVTLVACLGGVLLLLKKLSFSQKSQDQLNAELTETKIHAARMTESSEITLSQKLFLESKVIELEDKNRALEKESVESDTRYVTLKEAIEQERQSLTDAKENMSQTFKSLAADVLEGNNKQFLELAKSRFDKVQTEASGDLEKRQTAIDALIIPLKTTLDQYQKQVGEIEKERQKSYNSVEAELKRVIEANSNLASQTRALKNALKKPHVRGRWGEIQLKNCIELAGMSEYADVKFQDIQTQEDGSKLIPDMTVSMPGGRMVVVDCKTPLEAFISSLEATDEALRDSEMIRHGRHVKEHVQSLATKDYARNIDAAADFTVMFLPNESFLYAALESQGDLVEYALQKRILIATPPTLVGLLKVIRFGWNEEKIAENASKISEVGTELHKRVCEFADAFADIGKHLDKAKHSYDTGIKRLESRVLVSARRLEDLGAKSNKRLPEA